MGGIVIALIVGALAFFGYRAINASNIHSYDEGTPEQRAKLHRAFGPGGGPPPKPGTPPVGQ